METKTVRSGLLKSACYRAAGFIPLPLIKSISRARWQHPWLKRWLERGVDVFRDQDGIIKHGVGQGLRFNIGGTVAGFLLGSSEPTIQKVLQMLVQPGAVVYDIGANVGFLTVIAARLTGPSGRVFAFEPLTENFRHLEHNIHLNDFDYVNAIECALADRDETALFLISKSPTWGELASVSGRVEDEIGRTEVTVCRLDTIVQQRSFPMPNLIKIDVEGAEVLVLNGALTTIQQARPILLIELHGTNAAIAEKLSALGYFPVVVEGAGSIVESHWNAHVVAFPAPCPELEQIQSGQLVA